MGRVCAPPSLPGAFRCGPAARRVRRSAAQREKNPQLDFSLFFFFCFPFFFRYFYSSSSGPSAARAAAAAAAATVVLDVDVVVVVTSQSVPSGTIYTIFSSLFLSLSFSPLPIFPSIRPSFRLGPASLLSDILSLSLFLRLARILGQMDPSSLSPFDLSALFATGSATP